MMPTNYLQYHLRSVVFFCCVQIRSIIIVSQPPVLWH
ncbi:hypothetical protein AALP_AA8G268700 [Arabis alpina]|uniref:Uncharacterized protein n=1 Tax=Arabis alpina TaxID=50452 RepID=A0A087G9N9_ARAAL|nr:hypothetical protein AALP_AA8G268700 [Arabis alpina]